MLSVQQMFYGNKEEPVWLVDGSSPAPVKYHYLGPPPREVVSPPRRMRDRYYDDYYSAPVSDPYYAPTRRVYSSPPRTRAMYPPQSRYGPSMGGVQFSSSNPPPAPMVVPSETAISHTQVVPVETSDTVPSSANVPYTLLLRVPICCEGCERRVVKKLLDVDGVMSVRCDIERQRVTVRGTADTDEVLRVAKKAFKKTRLW